MRGIQSNTMIFYALRATGALLFFPKGALTHHLEWAVVLPAATVRSARRMRLLREPYGQCHITAVLLSLSTQLVCDMCHTEYRHFNRRYSTNCPQQTCHRQLCLR